MIPVGRHSFGSSLNIREVPRSYRKECRDASIGEKVISNGDTCRAVCRAKCLLVDCATLGIGPYGVDRWNRRRTRSRLAGAATLPTIIVKLPGKSVCPRWVWLQTGWVGTNDLLQGFLRGVSWRAKRDPPASCEDRNASHEGIKIGGDKKGRARSKSITLIRPELLMLTAIIERTYPTSPCNHWAYAAPTYVGSSTTNSGTR